MSTEALLEKMYEEIKGIRKELDEIKVALIPEVEPAEDELMEIREGEREIAEGKHRPWKAIKRGEGARVMFEVHLTNRAEKAFRSLENIKLKNRIGEAIDKLTRTYFPKGCDVRKLKGVKNKYRLRIGGFRIIYHVDFGKSEIFILSIIPRKIAYR